MGDLVQAPTTLVDVRGNPILALGGAMEGAEQFDRETVAWMPSMRSPDQVNNVNKPLADARGRDIVRNDGYATGAMALHKDNIVGSRFRLNASPNWRVLGVDETWAQEFKLAVEARFTTVAESEKGYLDAAGRNTLTGMVRLAVGQFVMQGEVLATAEWAKKTVTRPCRTMVQMIAPERLSNPNNIADTKFLRRGVLRGNYGEALSYFIRAVYPTEVYPEQQAFFWNQVAATKPWGRTQVVHIIEQLLPDQTRGVAEMVAVLKQMRMTKKYQEVVLQNAVVNASYAAAIESELPSMDVMTQLGANDNSPGSIFNFLQQYLGLYMGAISDYADASKNIAIDGVKIPHLFPGTKLNLQNVGQPGGVGTHFEESLLRHTAAALGLSYEQFSRDYTKTNYSSARASMNETFKFMQSRKKMVADRFANQIYQLWLEEDWNNGNLPVPEGKDLSWFYQPLVKDALCRATWIGASRGQIDELKETQAAILRVGAGFSTYEMECARLGDDYREIFEQRAVEDALIKEKGLVFQMGIMKPNGTTAGIMPDAPPDGVNIGEIAKKGNGEVDDLIDEEADIGASTGAD